MRRILLDANLLIAALDEDGTSSAEARSEAKQTLTKLLSDEEVVLVITPLIRYEVLRNIDWQDQKRFKQIKQALDDLALELEISRDMSELATNLFRFERSEDALKGISRNINKRNFDVFHFASAKCQELEFVSRDSDITVLNDLYERYVAQEAAC